MSLSWELFRHYLLSRRAGALIRTVAWLCVVGVALGVMALVVVISVMNGFNDQIRRRLLAVEPHLLVQVPSVNTPERLREQAIYKELSSRPGLQVEIYESQDVILRTVDGFFGGAIARGLEPEALDFVVRESQKALESTSGRKQRKNESENQPETFKLAPGEVILGIDLARGLGVLEGDKIVIIAPEALLLPAGEAPPFERMTVRSLISTNIQDVDARVLFFSRGQSLNSLRSSVSREVGYEIRLKNPEAVDKLKAEVVGQGLKATTWIERNSALFYALKMEKLAMGIFLGLSALIASFSIITVLVLLLTQKRKDIGVLMSMGLSPRRTRTLFVRVGLILSGIGILGGLISGIVICLIVDNYRLPILPDIYYDATIPATIDPRFIAGVLIASAIVAYLSADLPARAVTSESPADALSPQRK